jgi:hypothetical protein
MIFDMEHYLRMSDFVKMGKMVLERFAIACTGLRARVETQDLASRRKILRLYSRTFSSLTTPQTGRLNKSGD